MMNHNEFTLSTNWREVKGLSASVAGATRGNRTDRRVVAQSKQTHYSSKSSSSLT